MTRSPSLSEQPRIADWIRINKDGTVAVSTGKVELGQRITTALAVIAAQELDVSFDRVRMLPVTTAGSPNEGITSGSNSIQNSGGAIRLAAAAARAQMLANAAAMFDLPVERLAVTDGEIHAPGSNHRISYWDLQGDQPLLGDVPDQVELQESSGGLPDVTPPGLVEQVTGAWCFSQDLERPGMVHARVVHPPGYHHRIDTLDDRAVREMPGVIAVVRNGSFLAVAAEREEQAVAAAARLNAKVVWSRTEELDERPLPDQLATRPCQRLRIRDGVPQPGDAGDAAPLREHATHLSAEYFKPYIMHGSIGPSAALAHFEEGRLSLHSHSQGIFHLRDALANVLDLPAPDIVVSHVPGPGCYGHNGADDVALEAALVAVELPGRPVLLKWERGDEHAWEPYGSAMLMRMSAGIDEHGAIVDWHHESHSDTHTSRPNRVANQPLLLAANWLEKPWLSFDAEPNMGFNVGIHRNAEPLYDFADTHIVKRLVNSMPLRVSALRSLGGFGNVFAIESFVDELAHANGEDPIDFRLRHLSDLRARAVIERLLESGRWRAKKHGVGRGIGFARYANIKAYAAVLVEVTVSDYGEIRLQHATVAADAGQVIDADGLRMQLEGAFLQAASWTLKEQVTFDRDRITSRDWDSYPILRFDEVPELETLLIDRADEPPLGAGEAATGPTAGAIANAVFDACGVRLRRMPFTPEQVRLAAAG